MIGRPSSFILKAVRYLCMGSFDLFVVACPDCGAMIEFQTKARTGWSGEYERFDASSAPELLLPEMVGAEQTCGPCGRRVKLNEQLQPERMLNRGRKDP